MYIIGKVLKPQGIKGEIKAEIITSFPGHFAELKQVHVKTDEKWQAYSIVYTRISNRFVFIKFEELNSIAEAEKLRNRFLYIPRSELTLLQDDEYYIHDLIGCSVYDENERLIGNITDVEEYSGNDVYLIKNSTDQEFRIPAIEQVIKEIDISRKKVMIHVIEGLLD